MVLRSFFNKAVYFDTFWIAEDAAVCGGTSVRTEYPLQSPDICVVVDVMALG